jgi:DNA-binding HxlR family transcriptional regulator
MQWADYESQVCSIARTLDIVGERWTILIVRDLFNGLSRFDAVQQHLGVAKDLLSRRLTTLVEAGVVEKVGYQDEGQRSRFEYRLTPAGRELQALTVALVDWGDKHTAGDGGAPFALRHDGCGAVVHAHLRCENGHEIPVGSGGVKIDALPGALLRRSAG